MWVVVAVVAGFLVGGYLRAFAHAFVEEPDDTRAEFRRAVTARPVFVWPPLVELATAAACGLVVWRAAPPYLPGLLFFVLAGTALAVIDWRTFRLPDLVTLPSYPILALLLIPTGELPRALLGGLALAAVYGVLWFIRPTAMGLGDVKLAGLIGMAACSVSWQAWVLAAVAGQVLGALYAVGLLVTRKGNAKTEFPFGPFMLLGCLGVLVSG